MVTRYFGGVLLGTGGLIRAYQGAVKEALKGASVLSRREGYKVIIRASYDLLGKVEYYLNENGDIIREDTDYGEKVVFNVLCPEERFLALKADMTELSAGKVNIEAGSLMWYNI